MKLNFNNDTQEIAVNYENAICLSVISELIFTTSQRTIENLAHKIAKYNQIPIEVILKVNEPNWLIDELTELAEDLYVTSEEILETLQEQETTNEIS